MDFVTGGRLEVRITPHDMGKRISVRLLLAASAGPEKFTDVIGVLTSWTHGVLSITRRTGDVVRVPESSLVAGKVVPAAPARRRGPAADAYELDRVAARGWPPIDSARLGDWRLRAAYRTIDGTASNAGGQRGGADATRAEGAGGSGGRRRVGFTRRANSVLPLGDPGMPLDDALLQATAWYTQRGLPAYVQVSTGAEATQEVLAGRLAERGWAPEVSALIRIAALAPIGDGAADVSRVALSRELDDSWLARYQRVSEPGPEVRKVLSGGPSVWFATVAAELGSGAPPAAIGRCVVDGRWAGFTAVEVARSGAGRGWPAR